MLLTAETSVLPIHKPCEALLQRLQAKNWQAPGIRVEYSEHRNFDGERENPSILGENFHIDLFGRNKLLSLERLAVQTLDLTISPYNFALYLKVYAYTNWERDKEWFLRTYLKYHGKRGGAVRYLPYKSMCDCNNSRGALFEGASPLVNHWQGRGSTPQGTLHTHNDHWSCPLMVYTNEYRSEYEPVAGEPAIYKTDDVMQKMRDWLTKLLPTV